MTFMKATDLLHWAGDAHGIALPHRNGHQNGQQSGYILHYCCVDCSPGGRLDDTERVVAQWRRSVASGEALVMLHWEIGHQNGPQRRYIGSPPPPISTAVIIAKDHVMVH